LGDRPNTTKTRRMERTIAVLALQGCVEPHRAHVEAAGARFAAAKTAAEIGAADALILPGGESTTMLRLLRAFGLWDSWRKRWKAPRRTAWGSSP